MRSNISNDRIQRYLARAEVTEDNDQARTRHELLKKLRSLLEDFVRRAAQNKSLRRDDFVCQLMPFGSYGLGGYLAGADMDLVLLSAFAVERRDFYKIFPQLLRRITEDGIEVIRRTAVPIIKCTIDSIPVDISFVRLRLADVPENINLLNDDYMEGLDKECLASMDGPRTQQYILDNIKPEHMPAFQCGLQCIKYWATQRYLYGKPMGYLNGSTWTFLLMKTYQNVANSDHVDAYNLLHKFFDMWTDWPWPEPVLLTGRIPGLHGEFMDFQDLEDFEHSVMPIVSPCYPVCNSAPFVTASTLQILTQELKRARTIMKSDNFLDINSLLSKLFKELKFFARYRHFLRVMVMSETIKSNDTWKRKMATAIPKLVELLEVHPSINVIHPYTKSYTESISYRTTQGKLAIQEGYTDYVENFATSFQPGRLHVTTHLIGLEVGAPAPEIDLSNEIGDFLNELEAKRNNKDADVTFKIVSAKRSDLRSLAND
ncbi:Poly(A) polymerase central domain-containing protein [Zychaea mexicana]|uniref:Poly(A) polymerase central domain-containing protein n=1 Tax=Zychaea mexicana TaxID=64656 RepID=UPI0022FE6A5E|nr:Poly(A) polymerase central domain-containing protein [Zychaea mexicana]KAI9491748.1 Poly(A) polymerase central domain-containing protein [Zychaea mexicana]